MRPFTDSRSERVWVDRGSIAYSAVTQPSPLPLRHRGTPWVTDAAHSTRVLPNSTSTDPSAWSSQPRVMRTSRSWSGVRPSMRAMLTTLGRGSDVVRRARCGELHGTVDRRLGSPSGHLGVVPRREVGEDQPAGTGPGRRLARLTTRPVQVLRCPRVAVGLEGRIQPRAISVPAELDQVVAGAGAAAVGERPAVVLPPHPPRLD